MNETLLKDIEETVYQCMELQRDEIKIGLEDDLQSLGMDSIVFIQFVVILENKFEIYIDPEDMLLEQFNTIQKTYDIILKLVAGE